MSENAFSEESNLSLVACNDKQVPETEVKPKQTRRRLTAAYKRRILIEADECTERGALGEMLRSEGLYFAQLCKWRKQLENGELIDRQRGRKKSCRDSEDVKRLKKQEREIASLKAKLQKAEGLIELQKKIAELLEN
jgi:transposase-like protein